MRIARLFLLLSVMLIASSANSVVVEMQTKHEMGGFGHNLMTSGNSLFKCFAMTGGSTTWNCGAGVGKANAFFHYQGDIRIRTMKCLANVLVNGNAGQTWVVYPIYQNSLAQINGTPVSFVTDFATIGLGEHVFTHDFNEVAAYTNGMVSLWVAWGPTIPDWGGPFSASINCMLEYEIL